MHIEVHAKYFLHNIETNYKKEKQLGIAFIKQVTNAKDYLKWSSNYLKKQPNIKLIYLSFYRNREISYRLLIKSGMMSYALDLSTEKK